MLIMNIRNWKAGNRLKKLCAALAVVMLWGTLMPQGPFFAGVTEGAPLVDIRDSNDVSYESADAFIAALNAGMETNEYTERSLQAYAEATAAVRAAAEGSMQQRFDEAAQLAEQARASLRADFGTLGNPDWHYAGPTAFNGNAVTAGADKGDGEALTVSFTMKADALRYQIPIDKLPASGGAGWTIKLRNNGDLWFRIGSDSSNSSLEVTSAYSGDAPVHIAATYAQGTAKVYINGELKGVKTGISQTVGDKTVPLQLGKPSTITTSEYFQGNLKDVFIFERALEAEEVKLLAEADKTYLNYAVAVAGYLVEGDYTEGWADLQAALAASGAVIADRTAEQAAIDEAAAVLMGAMNALQPVAGIPVIQLAGVPEGPLGSGASVAVNASVHNAEDAVLGILGLPPGAEWNAGEGLLTWTTDVSQAGKYEIIFTANVAGSVSHKLVRMIVAGSPEMEGVNDISAVAGTELTYRVIAADPVNLPLAYSASELPEGAVLDASTGILKWTPQPIDYGSHSLVIEATNGQYVSQQQLTVNVELPVINAKSYTRSSYYTYTQQLQAFKSAMALPSADKAALAGELAAAEAGLVSSATLASRIAITEDMVIASHRSWDKTKDVKANGWAAFDGNAATATDTEFNPGWIQIDFGAGNAKQIDYVRLLPRAGGTNYQRMNGAVLEGSQDGQSFAPLLAISKVNGAVWQEARLMNEEAYRYVRYYSAAGNANVAEIELYEPGVDATLLERLLSEYGELDTDLYTEASYAALSSAAADGASVLEAPQPSQAAIDEAVEPILAAMAGLESRYTVSLAASMTGPAWSKPGAPLKVEIGSTGDEFAFTAMDITLAYDPAVVSFPLLEDGEGGLTLDTEALTQLKDGLEYLDSSISEQQGQIRMLLWMNSKETVNTGGTLLSLIGQIADNAPLGSTEIRLLEMKLAYGSEPEEIREVKANTASAKWSVNILAAADKSALIARIGEARELLAGAAEGSEPDQYPAEAIQQLTAAIAAANTAAQNALASDEETGLALAALNTAIIAFQNAKIPAVATELGSLIAEAAAKLAKAKEGVKAGQYPAADKQALSAAVQSAKTTAAKAGATQQEVNAALASLQAAYGEFLGNRITLTGESELSVADLAIAAGHYGAKAGDTGWPDIAAADVNGNGRIEIADITTIAKLIAAG
jgi:hypothetical protein